MKTSPGTTIIRNGQLVDGNGGPPLPDAVVVVRDGRIQYAGTAAAAPALSADARQIDARGGTIMPGLVEAHFHATYFNVAELTDLDIKYPVEYVDAAGGGQCQLALECGYTAARSGGSLFNIDVWLKKGDRGRSDSRSAAGGERARDLRRRRADGLEPRISQDRHGRPGAARQRRRTRPGRRSASWSRTASNGSRPIRPATPPRRTPTTTTRSA